eukprot:TRINITY_DN4173_c0_g1_i1.p1 TRINITY_DN4173_c0_g1~~TRINITY_DN4173_c0_g1_i1.p1  ORF type:complete len:453 (+),score=100.92 TRINITY_DN4173_c0_g1_i1:71-1429(+)
MAEANSSATSASENVRLSDEKKNLGNKALTENHFEDAINLYTEAIELNPSNAILWSNRAQAHIKMEEYGSAVEDASKSIELDPNYLKGYFRRGSAYMALFKYKDALKDFRTVHKKAPKDESNVKKMKECEKIIQRSAFEAAISADRHAHPHHIDTSKISVEEAYHGPKMPQEGITLEFVKELMEYQRAEKNIHRKYVIEILEAAKKVLSEQPTLVDIDIPENGRFTVCGDVHGQYYDLLNIFRLNGLPSEQNPYLFNGDFVDRGSFSVEVIVLLLAFKVLYPKHFHLARGNHESRNLNKMYGFEGEVKYKYNEEVFELFLEVFCWLPLVHVLNKKVFVVHGGLCRKDGVKLDDIRKVDRNREPPEEGIMCDLLWSDPQPHPGRTPSKRGVGVNFGPDVTRAFLDDNGLEMIVRSHEVKQNGYQGNNLRGQLNHYNYFIRTITVLVIIIIFCH